MHVVVRRQLWGSAPVDAGGPAIDVAVNTSVRAFWRGHGRAFPCVVVRRYVDTDVDGVLSVSYDVRYEDGARERNVPAKHIMSVVDPSGRLVEPSAAEGAADGPDADAGSRAAHEGARGAAVTFRASRRVRLV